MSTIVTYSDQQPAGTFSQINLDDGNKILISLTQTEIAIFQLGFLSIPKKTLWKADIFKFLDIIYPEGENSKNSNESVLKISVDLALGCNTLEEVKEEFNKLILDSEN